MRPGEVTSTIEFPFPRRLLSLLFYYWVLSEQHREKVREHRKKLQNGIISEEPQATPDDEADLWRRLDELELQEELQHELDL